MMHNINKIMTMLDWNNNSIIQAKGRKLADKVQCLKIFIQPCDYEYNKNVWENCAIILSNKDDQMLQPYLFDLLNWLQDLNWPGALKILERLKLFKNYEILSFAIEEKVKIAKVMEDNLWLLGMSELLEQEYLLKYLSDDAIAILKECRKNL